MMNKDLQFRRRIQGVMRKYAREGERFIGGCCNMCRGGACGGNFYQGGLSVEIWRELDNQTKEAMSNIADLAKELDIGPETIILDWSRAPIGAVTYGYRILYTTVTRILKTTDLDNEDREKLEALKDLLTVVRPKLHEIENNAELVATQSKDFNRYIDYQDEMKSKQRIPNRDTALEDAANYARMLESLASESLSESRPGVVDPGVVDDDYAILGPRRRKSVVLIEDDDLEQEIELAENPLERAGVEMDLLYQERDALRQVVSDMARRLEICQEDKAVLQSELVVKAAATVGLPDEDESETAFLMRNNYTNAASIFDLPDEDERERAFLMRNSSVNIDTVDNIFDDEDFSVSERMETNASTADKQRIARRMRTRASVPSFIDVAPTTKSSALAKEILEEEARRKQAERDAKLTAVYGRTEPRLTSSANEAVRWMRRGPKYTSTVFEDVAPVSSSRSIASEIRKKDAARLAADVAVVETEMNDAQLAFLANCKENWRELGLKGPGDCDKIFGKPSKRKSKASIEDSAMSKKLGTTWVKHVKAYAKKHNVTYSAAMSLAGPSWRGCKVARPCPARKKVCRKTPCATKKPSQRWAKPAATKRRAASGSKTAAKKRTAKKKAPARKRRGAGMVQ